MTIHLFGVRYGRGQDVDWFDNPHKAVALCEKLGYRKIIWLTYQTESLHPYIHSQHEAETSRIDFRHDSAGNIHMRPKSKAWQTVRNLSDFKRRHLPGFAPPDSKKWIDEINLPGNQAKKG